MKIETLKIGEATLTAYIQKNAPEIKNADRRPAVLILPGGGYEFVSNPENEPVALEYSAKGFQAFTLEYSVKEKGVLFRCTAAVGGGIGWFSELERARRVQSIREVGGIMNGTCNYILDNMTRQGLNYDDVLKQAQALGYAEANPSTDVDGIDTWHKVILSSNIAFGVSLDKETVPVAGIRNIKAEDVENFKAHGLVCKLIATGKRENGVISAYVQPTLVKDGEPEAAVPMNYNLITFVGETSQRMSFFGQGAGRYPTAYNVVQDLVDVLAGKGFYAPYGGRAAAVNDEKLTWYVRGNWNGETKEHWGSAAVTAPVSVAAMHAWLKENPNAFAAAIRE